MSVKLVFVHRFHQIMSFSQKKINRFFVDVSIVLHTERAHAPDPRTSWALYTMSVATSSENPTRNYEVIASVPVLTAAKSNEQHALPDSF